MVAATRRSFWFRLRAARSIRKGPLTRSGQRELIALDLRVTLAWIRQQYARSCATKGGNRLACLASLRGFNGVPLKSRSTIRIAPSPAPLSEPAVQRSYGELASLSFRLAPVRRGGPNEGRGRIGSEIRHILFLPLPVHRLDTPRSTRAWILGESQSHPRPTRRDRALFAETSGLLSAAGIARTVRRGPSQAARNLSCAIDTALFGAVR